MEEVGPLVHDLHEWYNYASHSSMAMSSTVCHILLYFAQVR